MSIPLFMEKRYVGRYPGARPPLCLLTQPEALPVDDRKRVLIVDDDPFFRELLKLMLAQTGLPLMEIREAEESRTALALCQEQAFDLVFCDLNLPRACSKNGIQIVHEVRKIRPGMPVYMVTADNEADLIDRVRSAGATGHILKPVNLRVLRRVLSTVFSSD